MDLLPPEALDCRGYIIDQSKTDAVPFRPKGSVQCGCGWIAAYNLHRRRGDDVTPQQVARSLNRLSPMSGIWGVNVVCLLLYLLVKGFRPRLQLITSRSVKMGEAGIIMYKVRRGGHYVMYELLNGNTYRFSNAVYGRHEYLADPAQFMEQRSKWPLAASIKVGKKVR